MPLIQDVLGVWIASPNRLLELLGWLPILVLSIAIIERIKDKESLSHNLFTASGGIALVWGIGVVSHLIILLTQAQLIPALNSLVSGDDFVEDLAQWLRPLDESLQPATDEIFYFFAVTILMKISDFIHISEKFQYYVIFPLATLLISYAFYLGIASIIRSPCTILLYVGFGFGTMAFFMRNGKFDLLPGIKIRRGNDDSETNWTSLFRMGLIFVVLCGFWYKLVIDASVLSALYSSAIGGLLAIIGFAALVFTFTFETISSVKFKRWIARDTTSFQQAAMVVLVSSILGLNLVDGPIILDHENVHLQDNLRVAIFVCAFTGLLVAVDNVLELFRLVVRALVDLGVQDAKANVRFEESLTDTASSILSDTPAGLSELRHQFEDAGCNVVPISEAQWVSLAKTPNLILTVPKTSREVPESWLEGYGQVVDGGAILLLLLDRDDYDFKRPFLRFFGFQEPKIVETVTDNFVHPCLGGTADQRPIGTLAATILFDEYAGQHCLLALTNLPEHPTVTARAVAVARPFGEGWVVVFSARSALENGQLKESFNFRVVRKLIDDLVLLVPQDSETRPRKPTRL